MEGFYQESGRCVCVWGGGGGTALPSPPSHPLASRQPLYSPRQHGSQHNLPLHVAPLPTQLCPAPPWPLSLLYASPCSRRAGRDGAPALSLLYASTQELQEARRMERGARQGAVAGVAAYIQARPAGLPRVLLPALAV